jgi:RNA polymerase sigma-70 factor (ECF subfamily)
LWREVLLRAPEEDVADESTPELELERLRAQRRLERILDRMSPVKRATFIMFELEGLPCEQIAEVTGVPVGTVYSRLHSARRQFERLLRRVPVEKGARHG